MESIHSKMLVRIVKRLNSRNLSLSSALTNKVNVKDENKLRKMPEWDNALPYETIPGPTPWPLIGNVLYFLIGPFSSLKHIIRANETMNKTYGKICAIRKLGPMRDFLFVFDINDIQTIYRNEDQYPIREGFQALSYYRNVIRKDIFGDAGGLLTVHGEKWQSVRSIVNPILLPPRTAEQYIGSMNSVADDFIERLRYLEKQYPNGAMPDDFDNEINKWSFESISVVALDKRLGCLEEKPNHEAQTMVTYMVAMFKMMRDLDFTPLGPYYQKFNTPIWKRFIKYQDYFTNVALKYIDEAENKIKNSESYRSKSESEKSAFEKFLQKDKKVAMVMTLDMLTAGIDTTGKTTGAALYFLAKNPRVQTTLRNELLELLPRKDAPITKETLSNAKYLKAVIKEVTRIAPVATGNMRLNTKNSVLSGYQIPSGVNVIIPNLYLSLKEENYVRPKEFLPERWIRTTTGELSYKNVNPFVTMPFGFGARSCIGKRLANLEMEIVVAKIIRNFELTWLHKDMTFGQDFLYGMLEPLKLNIKSI